MPLRFSYLIYIYILLSSFHHSSYNMRIVPFRAQTRCTVLTLMYVLCVNVNVDRLVTQHLWNGLWMCTFVCVCVRVNVCNCVCMHTKDNAMKMLMKTQEMRFHFIRLSLHSDSLFPYIVLCAFVGISHRKTEVTK